MKNIGVFGGQTCVWVLVEAVELKLQMVMGLLKWVLRAEPQFFGRATIVNSKGRDQN